MAHHARRRIIEENAGDPLVGFLCAVTDNHHPRMLRKAHADTAAMMQADPGCPARGIEERIQERPVRDGIRTVLHPLRLPIGAGNRP